MVSCWALICGRDSSVKQALPHVGSLLRNTQSHRQREKLPERSPVLGVCKLISVNSWALRREWWWWEEVGTRVLVSTLAQPSGSAWAVVICFTHWEGFSDFLWMKHSSASFEADPDLILSPRKFKEHVKCQGVTQRHTELKNSRPELFLFLL